MVSDKVQHAALCPGESDLVLLTAQLTRIRKFCLQYSANVACVLKLTGNVFDTVTKKCTACRWGFCRRRAEILLLEMNWRL